MAVYGMVNYDVARQVDKDGEEVARQASYKVPSGLRKLGWLATSKSCYLGDLSRRDEVMALLNRYLTDPKDVIFPALPVEKSAEKEVQAWARQAAREFFEEVLGGMRSRVDALIDALDKGKLGIADVAEKVDIRAVGARKKLEEVMVALATFRLSDEFEDFRKAKLTEIETMQDEVLAALTLEAAKINGEDLKGVTSVA